MNRMTRRRFIQGASATAGILMPQACVLGANNDIRVAVVGVGIRGRGLVQQFRKVSGVRVVALCDVDRKMLGEQAQQFKERNEPVATYTDVRKLLEDRSIDAVGITTPNHWHALMTIWACQAGKDVYVEKPTSHNIWEGRQAVTAAHKHKRIVQAGTQNRSDVGLRAAVEYLRSGKLGKVLWAHGIWFQRRESIGKVDGPQQVPSHIDYNLWTGPAPLKPLMRKNLHYDWNWDWSTGNGDMGNLGVHQLDDCRFLLGHTGLPSRVLSLGGRFGYVDDGQTPNTQLAILDYNRAPILIEIRTLPMVMESYRGVRLDKTRLRRFFSVIRCEQGYLGVGRGGGWAYDLQGRKIRQFKGDGGAGHPANFIKAVRSRKRSELRAELEQGHFSSVLCHVANISYRSGARSSPRQVRDVISSNPQSLEAFESLRKHLELNRVNRKDTSVVLGPWLRLDPRTEKFVGETATDRANGLLTREYRKPFVVPEKV